MYASLGANLSRYAMLSLSIEDPFLGGGAQVALCIPVSHCQDKGNSKTLRAGLAWICAAWMCWLIRTMMQARKEF